MNLKAKRTIIVVGIVLLAILAIYGFLKYPLYPQAELELDSIQMLRDKLNEYEGTRKLVLVSLSEYDVERQSQSVLMSGRNRTAKPHGYYLALDVHVTDEIDARINIVGKIPDSDDAFAGESYRNGKVNLEIYRDETQRRVMVLSLLCEDYLYSIDTAYDISGLSEQEITEREETLKAFLYSIADRIIDAAQAQ